MQRKHFCQLDDFELGYKIYTPNASLYDKIITWFRKITMVSENHPRAKLIFRSFQAFTDEKRRHTARTIHPYSSFQYYHQILYMFIYMFAPMLDLLNASFATKDKQIFPGTDTRTLIVNFFCLITVFINFFNGYITRTEKTNVNYDAGLFKTEEIHIILNLKKTARHYLKTYFFIDVLCVTNIFEHFFLIDTENHDLFVYSIFPIRLLRFIRMRTVMQTIKTLMFSQHQEDCLQIVQNVMFFLFSIFFFGCMLCLIPNVTAYFLNSDAATFTKTMKKLYARSASTNLTTVKLILHSQNQALCLLLLSKGHLIEYTISKYIIVTLTTMFGMVLKVSVFLSVYSIIYRRHQSRIKYISFMKDVESFIQSKNLTADLAKEIISYYEERLKNEYFDETTIFNTIQKNMHYEIFSQSSMDFLKNCILFKNLPNYFIVQLSFRLKYETFAPGTKVIKVGDIATCMYFIANGTVAVYNKTDKEICHLSDGEYFGEIGIIHTTPRLATVITIEYCELYRLDIHDFQEVIKPSSEFYKRITRAAIRRIVKST